MGTSLSGLTPQTTFDGLLKVGDNDPLTADLKAISDGSGNDSAIQLSTGELKVMGQFNVDTDTAATIMSLRGDGLNINQVYQANNTTYNTISMVNSAGIQFKNLTNTVAVIRSDKFGLGIGSSTVPSATAHIKGSGATSATTSLLVQNSAGSELFKLTDDGTINLGMPGDNPTIQSGSNVGKSLTLGSTATLSALNINLSTYNGINYTPVLSVTGNTDQLVGIGETTPTAKLHIKGDGTGTADYSFRVQNAIGNNNMQIRDDGAVFLTNNRYTFNATGGAVLKGSGATSATTALLVQNSAGTNLMSVRDDGKITGIFLNLSSYATVDRVVLFGASTSYLNKGSVVVGHTYPRFGQVNETYNTLHDISNYTSSSGTGTYTTLGIENTINQTGTASGITRGVYVNPTLTSAVDYRSIETTGGKVILKSSGNTATTTALLVQNSDGADMLKILDDRSIETYDATGNVIAKNNADNRRFQINPDRTSVIDFEVDGGGLSNLIRTDSGLNSVGIGTVGLASTRLHVKGSGATSATTALLVQNSAGTELLKVRDDGWIEGISTLNSTSVRVTGNLQVGGTNFKVDNTNTYLQSQFTNNVFGGVNTDGDASALVTMKSTTQGFLPPRMTTAQKTAITAPAAGLMVYDTDQNQMNYWNGSGWIAF